MKRNIRRLGAAIFLAVALAGCGASAGTIVEKDYHPAHMAPVSQCAINVSTGSCNIVIVNQYQPDRWSLTIEAEDGDRGHHSVSEVEWNSVEVGDHWTSQN